MEILSKIKTWAICLKRTTNKPYEVCRHFRCTFSGDVKNLKGLQVKSKLKASLDRLKRKAEISEAISLLQNNLQSNSTWRCAALCTNIPSWLLYFDGGSFLPTFLPRISESTSLCSCRATGWSGLRCFVPRDGGKTSPSLISHSGWDRGRQWSTTT